MKKPRVISLFTGAGGLDYGLEAAGFQTAVALEVDPDSAATLRANRTWPVIERDIHEVSSDEILKIAGLKVGEADLLVGGPPCQPFSKSGYWANGDAGRLEDPRASTLEAYLRVLIDTKPKAFLLENVAGLAYRKKDEGLELLRRTIEEINASTGTSYSFTSAVLNAADYGVPQERKRFFLVGHRDGTEFRFPTPTHQAVQKTAAQLPFDGELEPRRTAWDALGDLEDDDDPSLKVTGKWAGLLPSIPEGENYLFHTDRGRGLALFGWRRRYWSFLLKLSKRLPSWTVTAQPGSAIGPFHWKNRRLSVRELCRLQTFPENLQIVGSRSSCQRQLGNAVPSALAETLGLELRRLLGHRVRRTIPKLIPPLRTDIPSRERVRKVPEKYLHLVGEHESHPGTGQGYGAVLRAQGQQV
ncbi:MAG: DNA cytosine methyltransferase [Planctomycetota bacterium]|nr:DNA cytosine methyltransferase [Planctomycetota bacterium]